jgi:membrane protease YdiL (CAAX protease family)
MSVVIFLFPIGVIFEVLSDYSDLEPLSFAIISVFFYLVPGCWVFLDARKKKIDFVKLAGATVQAKNFRVILPAVFFLWVTSLGCVWLEHFPLSYVFPELVQKFLIEADNFGFVHEGRYCLAVNGVSLFAIVIVAPVVEEFVFRGFLLTRWASIWGASRAIIVTSVLFGLLHPDNFFGTTVVGMVLSLLYMRTRTLLIPILVHMLNNLVVGILVLYDLFVESDRAVEYSIGDFRDEWWIGALALAVGLPWTITYIKKNWPGKSMRIPYYYA